MAGCVSADVRIAFAGVYRHRSLAPHLLFRTAKPKNRRVTTSDRTLIVYEEDEKREIDSRKQVDRRYPPDHRVTLFLRMTLSRINKKPVPE